ncbi:MAG: acetyl-CoA carboxylase biotin carboxyl carrier protein [Phycisphaeraceae bacterium]|nr:acetyl-CoA carboxylase biotin carboxyl carrier protein [Phycisphaeraceae bacterium]
MIDLKNIKAIIKLMIESDLTEVDLEAEGEKIKLKRGVGGQVVVQSPPQAMMPVAGMSAPASPAPAAPASPASGDASGGGNDGLTPIASPMVGTFYAAASPDAPALAKVGAKIGPESVVCIIEAMKVFNEIKAELSGTIQKVLVQNGQTVEFGQPLFMVKAD